MQNEFWEYHTIKGGGEGSGLWQIEQIVTQRNGKPACRIERTAEIPHGISGTVAVKGNPFFQKGQKLVKHLLSAALGGVIATAV